MNTRTHRSFRIAPIRLLGVFGLGASLTFTTYADTTVPARTNVLPAADDDSSAVITAFWANTASNLNLSIDTSLYSFGLSALGLGGGNPDYSAEMLSQLQQISSQLTQIDNEVTQLDNDVKAENCNLDEATSVSAAVAHIRSVTQDYNNLLAVGGDAADFQNWINEVFDYAQDQTNSVSQNLVTINTGLMPAGTPNSGVIASCIAAMPSPVSGKLDDRTYYANVQNLTNYFYAVQAEGMAVEAEAYNYQAYQAWTVANPGVQLDPTQASSICASATGEVLSNCLRANLAANDVYIELQDEFAYAGAAFSTSRYQLLNGTNYLYALSVEDFTAAADTSCSSPLTVSYQCGPTAVTSFLASTTTGFFEGSEPVQYGSYNQWKPMTTAVMGSLFQLWTDKNQTLADYLSGIGFQNTANKIIFTPQTADVTVTARYDNDPEPPSFNLGQGVCFADTRLPQSNASQPFCSNLNVLLDTVTYTEAVSPPGGSCVTMTTPSWVPSGSSDDDFYQGLFNTGRSTGERKCSQGFEGTPPGYLLNYGVGSDSTQLLWPYIDVSTLSCTTNEDGSSRSLTNPGGVPTMCGADFDGWFQAVVPKPPVVAQ